MKSIVKQLMVVGLLVTMAGTTAFAKGRKSEIALSSDTKVNGTLLKKGMYEVVFDDQSGELSIFKRKKLVVKTATRVELRGHKASTLQVHTAIDGMDQKLVAITFKGSDQNVIVAEAGMQAGGN